jgi:hypothetical protein
MEFTTIHEYPSGDLERSWQECLMRVECPAHYDSPAFFLDPYWRRQNPFAILARDGPDVTGVLTGLHPAKQVISGLASRPQICLDATREGGPILDALLRGLLEEANDAELITVYTWLHQPLPAFAARGFRSRELEGNVVLDLTLGADKLFANFPKDRRRNIRFAEKNGVEIREVTTEQDIKDAYDVYARWRQTDRKEIKGRGRTYEVFAEAARLKNNRLVMVGRVEGKPIAMNLFRFFRGGLFESAANSSLEEYMHLKPNDLLQWRGIQWACANGMKRHSLGGAHSFLRRFGGTIVPVCRYRLDKTLLRKHDLQETVLRVGRETVEKMPAGIGKRVRSLLRPNSH